MGASLDCALFFGYDIGGPEEWKISIPWDEETCEYTWPGWVKSVEEGETEPDDLEGDMETELLRKMTDFEVIDWDYTGTSPRPEDYNRRMWDAKNELGFEFDTYGTDGYSGTVFGFCLAQGDWGVKVVAQDKLEGINYDAMRVKLAKAMEVLGIQPEGQPEPKLMLISSYF